MVKCNYCGENEATTTIPNPNVSGEVCKKNIWDVCKGCKIEINKAIKEDLQMIFNKTMDNALQEKNDG